MRLRKFVFALLPIAVLATACSDPTDPNPPTETGGEAPPSQALHAPAQPGGPAGLGWMA